MLVGIKSEVINRFIKNSQFLPFSCIGLVNTLIHAAILVLAVEKFELNVTLSNAIAFAFANIFSYLANSVITFKTAFSFVRYSRFFLASLISLILTLFISFSADYFGMHYLIGFSLIVVCVPVFSFFIMKLWAFAK